MGLPPMIRTPIEARIGPWAVIGVVSALVMPSLADAQTASSSLSAFSHGYGAGLAGVSAPVNVSTQDTLGGVSFSGGVLQAPSGSLFANLSSLGGTGAATTTATVTASQSGPTGGLPTRLNVVVPGSATPSPAAGDLNGKVNLDGAP